MMKFRLQAAARGLQGTNGFNRFAIKQPLTFDSCQLWRRKLMINELGFQCSACLLSKNDAVNAGQPHFQFTNCSNQFAKIALAHATAISTKLVHCNVMKTAGCGMHPAVFWFELTASLLLHVLHFEPHRFAVSDHFYIVVACRFHPDRHYIIACCL